MTLDKFFDDINEADLQQLIGNRLTGCKTVEYRECLPDDSFDSQKEFLAEVSSFANTAGGHLIYGIKEKNGIPVAVRGIPDSDPDLAIRRLEKLLRDNLQPACHGIRMRAIEMASTAPIILIRVPESLSKPHVVNFEGHWRFYARSSAGKYPLGIAELKSAILTMTGLGEQIRSFRFDRLNKISCGESPFPLIGKARTVFHLIPYSAFESCPPLSFAAIEEIWSIPLMYASTFNYRYNLDGLIVYSEKGDSGFSEGYTQVFRNGIIESVNANLFGSDAQGPYLPSATFETDLTAYLDACLAFYRKLSIRMPAVLLVSLAGVRDCRLTVQQHLNTWQNSVNRIDRDALLLPEVVIEDGTGNSTALMQPVFDAVWNAMGWERLYGYEEAGKKALLFPTERFRDEQVDLAQKAKGH